MACDSSSFLMYFQSYYLISFYFLCCLVSSTACIWNSNNRERCCYLQVSIWSHCCFGVSICCFSYRLDCGWVLVFVLPLQRQVYSAVCFVPKHQLHCILQHCFVSISVSDSHIFFFFLIPFLFSPFGSSCFPWPIHWLIGWFFRSTF